MSDETSDQTSDETKALEWLAGMPAFFQDVVHLTNRVTGRDVHVHRRTHQGTLYLMFDSVPVQLRPQAALVSALGVAIVCYVDYWADTVPSSELAEEAAAHMLRGVPVRSEELSVLPEMWRRYLETISEGPVFAGARELLMNEWAQLFAAMRYSISVNEDDAQVHTYRAAMTNLAPNMLGVHKHVVDIGFSPGWRPEWTEPALDLARRMEAVVRIGNCLKSWRQEVVLHRDISSTVCGVALDHGVIERASIKRDDPQKAVALIEGTSIPALGGLTTLDFLQEEMAGLLSDIERMGHLGFVDVPNYLRALRRVVADQLRGSLESR